MRPYDEAVVAYCRTHGPYLTQAERDGRFWRWECPVAGCNSTEELEIN